LRGAQVERPAQPELIEMWTAATDAAIFPRRRIGRLDEGYDASFLVLAGDPLEGFGNVTRITRRVKQGKRLP
jgi:imidazolonepropionase-like amidohydrolase